MIELAANTHTNYSGISIVLPIQIKKSTDKTANVNVITVNNTFCHWLNEIDARRYPDDVRILPTNNTVKIYQNAAQQLKYLPSKSLDYIRQTLLYEKKAVVLNVKTRQLPLLIFRWKGNQLPCINWEKIYYRIPLGFFTFLGLVNFPHKIDTGFLFTLENNLNRLFETNAKTDMRNKPNAQIIFHDKPYISYPQITLDDNFLAYFNGIHRSRGALKTDVISSR